MDKIRLDDLIKFEDDFTARRLVDVPETQINLICLRPGQAVPPHDANSNVRLLVLLGEISLTLGSESETVRTHEMAAAALGTPMRISNSGFENAAFLVIKTPNPAQLS